MKEDVVVILISALLSGLISTLISIYFNWKNNQRNIQVNFGSQEMQELQHIQDLELKITDCKADIEKSKADIEENNKKLKFLKIQYCNTPEALCGKYTSNKIDKENFIKMYKGYILPLFDNENRKLEYNIDDSVFTEMKKVYDIMKDNENSTKTQSETKN